MRKNEKASWFLDCASKADANESSLILFPWMIAHKFEPFDSSKYFGGRNFLFPVFSRRQGLQPLQKQLPGHSSVGLIP